ncbi:MATE family efflux transporter [Oscillospiraceae bacterium PP1C4]
MFTRRDLVRLIVPLMIEQVLSVTIGIADTLMVASVGEIAVSSVSLVDSVNTLLLQVLTALATGGAIVSAQYLGREDNENANAAARQLLFVTTLFSLVIMMLGLVGRTAIPHALFGAAEPAVMENACTYFWISALSYPLISVYCVGAALFRVQGNSKISMFAALLMNVTNISFNAFFIFGLNMGVAGAALGSLIARGFGAIFLMMLLYNHNNRIHVNELFPLKFQPKMIKNILRIGIPNGIENGIFHVGKILLQGLIASFGTMAIAANAVAGSITSVAQMPGSAVGLAMVTIVGQCVGARDYEQAKKHMINLTGASYVMIGVLHVCSMLFARQLIGLFHVSAQTANIAWQLCICCSLFSIFFWPAGFTLPNGLRAANDVKFTMIASIASMWIFRIGFSYVLGQWMGLGVLGVWIAMGIDWVARTVAFIIRFLSGKWKNIQYI